MSTFQIELKELRAQDVTFSEDDFTIVLADGRTMTIPLAWFPRLFHASPAERGNWRWVGGGIGIHWPDLDEDISVEDLILGRPSGESPESLRRWLEGRTTSDERRATNEESPNLQSLVSNL
jgi:hypothetical protein